MKVYDLTLQVKNGMRGVSITLKTSAEVEGYNTTDLLLYSHSGTHLDAPKHFMPDGKSLISGWNDGKVRAFLPQSGKLFYSINEAHPGQVTAIAGTGDSKKVMSGGVEG